MGHSLKDGKNVNEVNLKNTQYIFSAIPFIKFHKLSSLPLFGKVILDSLKDISGLLSGIPDVSGVVSHVRGFHLSVIKELENSSEHSL